jgi:hypothetical protein
MTSLLRVTSAERFATQRHQSYALRLGRQPGQPIRGHTGRHFSTATGDSLAREQVQASSKEQVLNELGSATASMRNKLGESLASVQKSDKPLEEATTPSLEALQAFTPGGHPTHVGAGGLGLHPILQTRG